MKASTTGDFSGCRSAVNHCDLFSRMVATVVLEPEVATTSTARRPTWGHRPALDGLRAVAVGLVIAFHVDLPVAAGGFVGVDLFFVLSGFVVTNVIWVELSTSNSLRLRRFYARRMRRLTPAALALVVGTALMYVLVAPLVERLSLVSDAQAALLYVANWHALAESTDYFESTTAPSPFLHFWSLAIEEQFYLLFPVLMVLLWKASRRLGTQRLIPWAIGILIAASLSLQLYWATRGANEAYYRTDARLYQLLAGALLAILIVRSRRLRLSRWFASLGLVGLAGLVILSSSAISATPSIRGSLRPCAHSQSSVGSNSARDRYSTMVSNDRRSSTSARSATESTCGTGPSSW